MAVFECSWTQTTMAEKPDRRAHHRTHMDAEAVLLHGGRHEPCRLRDLSGSGAKLVLPARPAIGTEAVLYTDEFGRFEGVVMRHTPFGISLAFKRDPGKLARTLEKLAAYAGGLLRPTALPQGPDARRVLLEALAISGRIAGSRSDSSKNFWEVIDNCRSRGWVKTDPISDGILAVEITEKGRHEVDPGSSPRNPLSRR